MLWDPVLQFGNEIRCPERACGVSLNTKNWKWGQSTGSQPRLLHDLDYTVLLVSVVWSCENNHEVLSTDPRILKIVSDKYGFMPFILLHKIGFTRAFIYTMIEIIQEGGTFSGVERMVKQKRMMYATSVAKCMVAKLDVCGTSSHSNFEEIMSSHSIKLLQFPTPNNDMFHQCFVAHFIQYREAYTRHMLEIPVKNKLSLDHTFKVSSNVGYCRSDGKWVTMYTAVFICMNDVGQVVGWQFTSSTSIDEVSELLSHISSRSDESQRPITVFVDNCCTVRNKIKTIFGTDTEVKLDIFHAIQRITRKMSKRHPFFRACKDDLKMIVRDPVDIGRKRSKSTASPEKIITNINEFEKKWSSCSLNGNSILSQPVLRELSALRVHIKKGCLSNISPGDGTNRNEVLHRHINPNFANKSRIGLPLALALITVLLFRHNVRIEDKITGRPSYPINAMHMPEEQNAQSKKLPNKIFGITQKYSASLPAECTWVCSHVDPSNKHVLEWNNSKLQNCMINITLSEDVQNLASLQDIANIIETAVNLSKLALYMHKQSSKSPVFNYKLIPFMSATSNIMLSIKSPDDQESQHIKRLDDTLRAWKMTRESIPGDGNCCFRAVASSLIINQKVITEHADTFFNHLGIDASCINQSDFAMKLRELVVSEWQQNSETYQGFLTDTTVEDEAELFRSSGYFNSELGDTVLLTLSNVLGVSIVVFTSISGNSVINIVP